MQINFCLYVLMSKAHEDKNIILVKGYYELKSLIDDIFKKHRIKR